MQTDYLFCTLYDFCLALLGFCLYINSSNYLFYLFCVNLFCMCKLSPPFFFWFGLFYSSLM